MDHRNTSGSHNISIWSWCAPQILEKAQKKYFFNGQQKKLVLFFFKMTFLPHV